MTDNTITHVGGALRDMYDSRDFLFDDIRSHPVFAVGKFEKQEATEVIIPEFSPISNQGAAGTCVSQAACDMFELLHGAKHHTYRKTPQISRRFLNWSITVPNNMAADGGAYPRDAFRSLRNNGVIDEKYMPYSDKTSVLAQKPDLDLFTMASNNRINSFYRLNGSGDTLADRIVDCIICTHPVFFCMTVTNDFQRYRGGGHVWYDMSGQVAGGHAMLIVGFKYIEATKKYLFLVRNSWSDRWGDDGYCWVGQDLITSETYDRWVGTAMEILQ